MIKPDSKKAKIARRVFEILEFFADGHSGLTVKDIVSRYGRPQSSTSELLSALCEMGLLYRDNETRRFHPAPRLAALGVAGQPDVISSGKLFSLMDKLAQSSRCSVALFGILDAQLQVLRWKSGEGNRGVDLSCGATCPLAASAAGELLLSTLGQDRAGKMLWRLKAEVDENDRFDLAETKARVMRVGQLGFVTGKAGIVARALVTAILLPERISGQPIALGVVYDEKASVDPHAIVETLQFNIGQLLSKGPDREVALLATRTLMAF